MEIYISKSNWTKLLNYANAAYDLHRAEIGGMAVCVEDKDGDWNIEQPVILKQEISGGNCILDKDELAKYYTKIGMSKKYKNKNYRFLWWHSHHTMGAFWSGTDLTAIEEFNEGDFSFALVINLKEEYKMRVSVWKPVEMHKDVDLNIIGAEKTVPKKILDEVKENCSTIQSRYKSLTTYNPNQATLFNKPKPTREELEFTNIYTQLWDAIEQSAGEVMSNELSFEDFTKQIKLLNSQLKLKTDKIELKIPEEDDVFILEPSLIIVVGKEFLELEKEIIEDLRFDHGYSNYINWS